MARDHLQIEQASLAYLQASLAYLYSRAALLIEVEGAGKYLPGRATKANHVVTYVGPLMFLSCSDFLGRS